MQGPSEGKNNTVNEFVCFSCQNTVVQFNQKLHAVICSGPDVESKQSSIATRRMKWQYRSRFEYYICV